VLSSRTILERHLLVDFLVVVVFLFLVEVDH
jgi:hypothetical protein